ncbi:hypothetical protein RhiirA1_480687 [Rhizophagus irregularis]|uniref:Uncharacterized protein n=1 Tax=Rhizophagus irregularis TaxID=588596 RepID=A0A2N0QP13_9GLOM|nr:hypothetical protein RhiirA1_480687 [Rhizophagus irregularis]
MQACSFALKIFKRANGGYMLRDTSRPLEVLSIHAELQTNRNYCFNPYYHAIMKKENIPTPSWVPLLPGHCVIGKFGSLYVRLEIQREISIPDILGLRNSSIIYDLQSKEKNYLKKHQRFSICLFIIYHGIEIKELGMHLSSKATLALAVEYEALKKLEDSSCKRIKRVKTNNEYIKNLKYKLYEEKDQKLLNN